MPLAPGTTLGTYEITGSLGAGGMGEVYRARDTRLGRSVAIKVLPEAFAGDADRVPRFEREAKVLASLNHPRVAALYGMEHGVGQVPIHFLIMELVEGETLLERLARGPVPAGEALPIAIQIAEALETAHEQGIVHRDLKPANIKITPDDKVKVLDFGLAKAMDSSPAASSPADSPTLIVLATQPGMIMGTAAYMSPEQAKGAAIDRRSDVFSFGVVLYEMLTGQRPFRGDTGAQIMASLIALEADLTALPAGTDPRLAVLLKRCLEKNPKKRWQAMGDLRMELEALAAAPTPAASAVPHATRPLWRRVMPIALLVAVTAGVSGFATRWLTPAPPRDVVRFAFPSPNYNRAFQNLALSPDGTRLIYVVNIGPGQRQLMLRSMGESQARPIPGAEGQVSSPSFSPDGQFVAFYSAADEALKKVAITGGPAVTLAKMVAPFSGPHWGPRGILITQPSGGLRVSPDGGEPEVVIKVAAGERISSPQYVGDSDSILFTLTTEAFSSGWEKGQVIVQAPDGARRVLVSGASDPRYLPSGHLVFASGANLLAAPFDLAGLRTTGPPIPIVEGISRGGSQLFVAHYAVSAGGSLAYLPAEAPTAAARRNLALLNVDGSSQLLSVPPDAYQHPRISPDGTRIVVVTENADDSAIWIHDLAGSGLPRRLTFDGRNAAPIWTRDGRFITFQSDREGDRGLFQQSADGNRAAERLTKSELIVNHFPESWSPDGKTLSLRVATEVTSIWTWSPDGDRLPKPLLHGAQSYAMSEFSPDGRWLAYASNELDGRNTQVFVQPYPPTGAKYQLPMNSSNPVWSRDGRRLFFSRDSSIFTAEIETAPAFAIGQPRELKLPDIMPGGATMRRHWDLMPDGKWLLVVLPENSADSARGDSTQIEVVVNGLRELVAKAPPR
ncbi:MAG: protein kinase [Acidobacteriota bacterium]|nr:protein kinase [Acidobacteriota bacterium]